MDISTIVDLNNLQKYSNIDVSTLTFNLDYCIKLAKLDYKHLSMFIDIFDDINKREAYRHIQHTRFTPADIIMYMLYYEKKYVYTCMNPNDKLKVHFKILQKRTEISIFKCSTMCYRYSVDYHKYLYIDKYLTKYSNIITNLYRLTNSNDIDICNVDDNIGVINMFLLLAKTRVVPKYIMLHKILFYYFC